jgi:hypothetical protein
MSYGGTILLAAILVITGLRMVAFAFIPHAGFVNERLLKRREDGLAYA